MKFVHITTDEKFIDGIHYLFEKAFPNRNLFIVLLSPKYSRTRNIKNLKDLIIMKLSPTSIDNILCYLNDACLIIFHGMNSFYIELLNISDIIKKTIYVVWGAEIYENPLLYKVNIYGIMTGELRKKLLLRLDFMDRIKNIYRYFRYYPIRNKNIPKEEIYYAMKKTLKKIKTIGLLSYEELDLYKKLNIIDKNISFQKLSYYTLEYIIKGINTNIDPGCNILVGNSSSLTNNHLEAFEILNRFEINNRKVIVPLNYGSKNLAIEIKKSGNALFCNKFISIDKFLNICDFNKILQSTGIVIMNHYRQQGVGSILASLYFGSKLYLSEKNIILSYLRNLGCFVYSIETDLVPTNKDALFNLSKEQIKHNRKILVNEISEKVLVKSLRIGLGKYLKNN